MSLPDLISGAECGPSNALQQLGKRFGQDRSSQLDRYGSAAGPSGSSSMRTQQQRLPQGPMAQHPLAQQSSAQARGPFDLSALGSNLPMHQKQQQRQPASPLSAGFHPSPMRMQPSPAFETAYTPHAQSSAQPAWAADFMAVNAAPARSDRKFMQARQVVSQQQQQQQQQQHSSPQLLHAQQPFMMQHNDAYSFRPEFQVQQPAFQPQHAAEVKQAATVDWASAFSAFDEQQVAQLQKEDTAAASFAAERPASQAQTTPADADDLAAAAGKLVETVEHETSDKFRKSNFLELMRRLRDRQAGIRGSDIVDTPDGDATVHTMPTLDKGKARALDPDVAAALQPADRDAVERMSRPENQQEAYRWANEMASKGTSTRPPPSIQESLGQVRGPDGNVIGRDKMMRRENMMQVTPGPSTYENETVGRQELAAMWAEEDALSERMELAKLRESEQKLQEAERAMNARSTFVGDGGDVEARQREDLFAQLEFEDRERERQRQRAQQMDDPDAAEFARFQRLNAKIPGAEQQWQDDQMEDAKSDISEDFVGRRWEKNGKGRGVPGAQTAEWAKLQEDWDQMDAAADGLHWPNSAALSAKLNLRAAPQYVFQRDNPYLNTTRTHAQHMGLPQALDSLLETEARVQSDPTDSRLWFDLGVKQQENERENLAIAALRRAVELDDSMRDAWLALAVSYTNENDRSQAFECIEQWIWKSQQYAQAVREHRGDGKLDISSLNGLQRHQILTETLMAMARHGSSAGEVDADVQIALGVLFNSSEEYDKAVDCFASALSVRPEDWLLYNRLGATLSNSGRSNEAISYYHHALSLQPGFVRCHFNLSISCLNLKLYRDAAEHIYSALSIQASQSAHLQPEVDGSEAGVGSGSLWETFRVALELMERPDLANMCSKKDINLFDPAELVPGVRRTEAAQ